MRHLREIMEISWSDKVTNEEVLRIAGLPYLEDILIEKNNAG